MPFMSDITNKENEGGDNEKYHDWSASMWYCHLAETVSDKIVSRK